VTYGPWSPSLHDEVERGKQLRSLQALVAVYMGSTSPLIAQLREAEANPGALMAASEVLDKVPSLKQRNILTTFAAITWPKRRK
jgi:class 3 adenylate cyclase